MRMSGCSGGDCACGCCDGIQVATPRSIVNARGLSALTYRAGDYGTFFETMLARLSSLTLELPADDGAADRIRPLARLTTRETSDPAIALLDAWAVVGDVLTFYQERIANEGYLPTALERRSLSELGRLVGYRPRPGVAASVKLAVTASSGFAGEIPAGLRAQSMPAAGQSPQFFETSAPLTAREAWNALPPLMARPMTLTAPSDSDSVAATDARVAATLYVDGVATSLKPSDRLLMVFGSDQQTLRVVQDIVVQASDQRTMVTLAPWPSDQLAAAPIDIFTDQAKTLFPGSSVAAAVGSLLATLSRNAAAVPNSVDGLIAGTAYAVVQQLDLANARGFTRLSAWLQALLTAMRAENFVAVRRGAVAAAAQPSLTRNSTLLASSALGNLGRAVSALAAPPSVQPAGPLHLARAVKTSFTPRSDMAPRLIGALRPAAATGLYEAWQSVETPPSRLTIYAARVRAGLFASTFAGAVTVTPGTGVATYTPPTLADALGSLAGNELPLDSIYDQIKPGSWVAIDMPGPDGRVVQFTRVVSARTRAMDTTHGFAAKVTVLTLADAPNWPVAAGLANSIDELRDTSIYAQAEQLSLTDEPVDADISGAQIDLAGVYDGLEPGRWIVVSGNRTDVGAAAGSAASELAMISAVTQGAGMPNPATPPDAAPPFASILYVTNANTAGDRLVVGLLRPDLRTTPALSKWALPEVVNQQYGQLIDLGPDATGEPVWATAYVPTAAERGGNLAPFIGLLVTPDTAIPYLRGRLPAEALAQGLFAWRIATPPLHTSLSLAAALAYSYDRGSVTIAGNVVDATQGQTVGEVLGDGAATKAFATFAPRQKPMTYLAAPTASGVLSTLAVTVNELAWSEVPDFLGAGPTARVFTARENDSGVTRITFGDGQHGARPPTGTGNIKAVYRYGMGSSGNLPAGQIKQLANQPMGVKSVVNPLPSTGGADADAAWQARANTPIATLALDRLVSTADFAAFARNFAGIGKAAAVRLSDGLRQVVHVSVAGANDIPIDPAGALAANLLAAFAANGDPHLAAVLGVRRARLLVIQAAIGLQPGYAWDDVAPAIRAAMLQTFGFSAREVGQPAYASEAIASMQEVEGVAYVNLGVFDSVGEAVTPGALAGLAQSLTVRPFVPSSLARIDAMAAPGTAGRILAAELVTLTPAIPDTLILTQVPA